MRRKAPGFGPKGAEPLQTTGLGKGTFAGTTATG
jgi:hypothetical protein